MERFKEGQNVRILTVDELLKKGYAHGDDFIYWAFRFAKNAVTEMSAKYAEKYGVKAEDEATLKTIQPKLIYNDYCKHASDYGYP